MSARRAVAVHWKSCTMKVSRWRQAFTIWLRSCWWANGLPLPGDNQHLHRASPEYRDAVRRKLHAYHVFIQAAVVCQGLLQYLAVAFPQRVWASFGSWVGTLRPGIPPSELVVANALRHSLPEFLLNSASGNIFAKFVTERQDSDPMQAFRLAS